MGEGKGSRGETAKGGCWYNRDQATRKQEGPDRKAPCGRASNESGRGVSPTKATKIEAKSTKGASLLSVTCVFFRSSVRLGSSRLSLSLWGSFFLRVAALRRHRHTRTDRHKHAAAQKAQRVWIALCLLLPCAGPPVVPRISFSLAPRHATACMQGTSYFLVSSRRRCCSSYAQEARFLHSLLHLTPTPAHLLACIPPSNAHTR